MKINNKKSLQKEEKEKLWKSQNTKSKPDQKTTKSKSLFSRGQKSDKQNKDNTYQDKVQDCGSGLRYTTWKTKYFGDTDRGRLYTHVGGEHRWKQSRIRDDVRPGTQEEGQVTWNERRVTFKIKHEIHKTDRKTRQPHRNVTLLCFKLFS